MIEATWADVEGFGRTIVSVLWIPLAVAVGGIALAVAWVTGRIVARRIDRRFAPGVTRWSRRWAGLGEDARPWACAACRSVNAPTTATCYHCGAQRPAGAAELRVAATDPGIFHAAAPVNRFDPSLYRGPGAPAPATDVPAAPTTPPDPRTAGAPAGPGPG